MGTGRRTAVRRADADDVRRPLARYVLAVAVTGTSLCATLIVVQPAAAFTSAVLIVYTAATIIGLRIPVAIVRRRVERQHEVSRTLASIVSEPQAVGRALEAIGDLFGSTLVELAVATDLRAPRLYRLQHGTVRTEERLPPPGSALALALHDAATISTTCTTRTSVGEHLRSRGLRSVLAAPLVLDGAPIGAIAVYDRAEIEIHAGHDRWSLSTVANDLAIALQNVELFRSVGDERAKLAEESAKLRDILDGASDGIALVDRRGRIRAWNPAMAETTGCPANVAIGERWSTILDLQAVDGQDLMVDGEDPIEQALAGRPPQQPRDLRLVRQRGGYRWLRTTFSPVVREGRGVTGVVLIARDVTREREADELKTDFISTVSHELRTPLTPLKGFLLTLIDGEDRIPAEDRAGFYTSMLRQVERLERLVADLLVVADIDRDVIRLDREPTDLLVIAEDAATMERPLDAPDRIRVVGDRVEAVGDEAAIRRIVRALVDNAVKHTDGPVTVEVGRDATCAFIAVHDEGPGIPRIHHELVFERFRRLGHHLTRTTQGSGLGLSIARSLTERLGGRLEVRSEIGQGATFTLSLPSTYPAVPDDPHKFTTSPAENRS